MMMQATDDVFLNLMCGGKEDGLTFEIEPKFFCRSQSTKETDSKGSILLQKKF